MAKIRVHELAKELGKSSKEMVDILTKMGLDVKNHMSTMEESQVAWVKKQLNTSAAKPDKSNEAERPHQGTSGEPADRPQRDFPKKTDKKAPVSRPQARTSEAKPGEERREKRDFKPAPKTIGNSVEKGRSPKDMAGTERKRMETKEKGQFTGGNKRPKSKATPVSGTDKSQFRDTHINNNSRAAQRPAPIQRRDYSRPQRKSKHKRKRIDVVLPTPESISMEEKITVRELAEKLRKSSAEIVKKLMELGVMASINQAIDFETVEILASLYEVRVERELSEEEKILEEIVDSEESLKLRPPVVTVMGHVDHGKTSLLDRIRKSDVVSGEAGGITQHIGAYQVKVNNNRITFIDTPGHEAFTAMRARGANLTDIVILVVAADDGVMPQTVEAVNHIKAAGVPFLVAINKIDKPHSDPKRVMQQLTEYNIVPEDWGGDTIFVQVSAKAGQGIDNLLEMVLLLAEVNELKANPNRNAEGVVIDSKLDKDRGAVATVLVQKGTLKIGDTLICGSNICKVRAMMDYRGKRVDKAYPSMPVEILGWAEAPMAGGRVLACDEKTAKEVINLRIGEKKIEEQRQSSRISLDDFFKHLQDHELKELNLIIKGDVQGSVEALSQSLLRLSTDEVKVNVIHSGVGAITKTDVMLASASNAIIIGFNVRPVDNARKDAEMENIDVRLYRVIYEAIEDVKKAMVGLLEPEYKEKFLGRAEVRATFKVPNIGIIAGSYVNEGKIQRNAEIRLLRDGVIVFEGKLGSLKRFKDDVKEVLEGYECGIGIKDFNDIKEADIIEAYTMEEVPRQL